MNYSKYERFGLLIFFIIILILFEIIFIINIMREKKILSGIFDYLKGKIVIVISHRFNNKKLFDRIIKIKDGNIIEL